MRIQVIRSLSLVLLASLVLVTLGRADGPPLQEEGAPSSPATVQVTTDRQSYAPGDTVEVTVTNLGPAIIMPRGGRVCDSFWPISLEQQLPDGWNSVPVPQDAICAGASVAPYAPGASLSKSFTAGTDEGIYRVVFAYDIPGGEFGTLPPAYSDPFSVQSQPVS